MGSGDEDYDPSNQSVERFSWSKREWAQLPPMKECRSIASAFVYENQIFVAGGDTDAMEVLKIDQQPLKCTINLLPNLLSNAKVIRPQNIIIFGIYTRCQ